MGRSPRSTLPHYGYTFDYKTFGIDPDIDYKQFPEWLRPLIPTTENRPPDQVCLQYYPPGAGIPPHVDAHGPYDQLYALSLGAPVIMQFRNGDRRVDVDLTPRSMISFTGDSRLHWTHGIKKRKSDILADGTARARAERWSITYRWLREGDCECGNVELCDVAQRRNGIEKEKRSVKALEARHLDKQMKRRRLLRLFTDTDKIRRFKMCGCYTKLQGMHTSLEEDLESGQFQHNTS
ncbi:hypothetical protein ARAM_002219 [Aspergillus rambellii]|uniref:Fe2OG dioxygenase domain-containing protein n=1 Tax=Aspergillus rambellii TaxID=308745 RepID=A0A0F8XFM8_9EURO|nr:hypothetical protein ARAM_002219 [Aspergillus rambellii]